MVKNREKGGSENNLDIEFLSKFLVSVTDGDFSHAGNFRYLTLGSPFTAENG